MMATRNLKGAREKLEAIVLLKQEIEDLKTESGIKTKEMELENLKADVLSWALKTDTEAISFAGGHAQLRRDKYGGTWVATRKDLDNAPDGVLPLLTVIRKKFQGKAGVKDLYMRVTKRVVDPEALSQVVEEGILTVEDVEQSYYEKEKAPYLRIYEE